MRVRQRRRNPHDLQARTQNWASARAVRKRSLHDKEPWWSVARGSCPDVLKQQSADKNPQGGGYAETPL